MREQIFITHIIEMSYSSRAHRLVNSGLVNHGSTSHHVDIRTLIQNFTPQYKPRSRSRSNTNRSSLVIFLKLKIFEIHTKTDSDMLHIE